MPALFSFCTGVLLLGCPYVCSSRGRPLPLCISVLCCVANYQQLDVSQCPSHPGAWPGPVRRVSQLHGGVRRALFSSGAQGQTKPVQVIGNRLFLRVDSRIRTPSGTAHYRAAALIKARRGAAGLKKTGPR